LTVFAHYAGITRDLAIAVTPSWVTVRSTWCGSRTSGR